MYITQIDDFQTEYCKAYDCNDDEIPPYYVPREYYFEEQLECGYGYYL
jgi:hypothetical protein